MRGAGALVLAGSAAAVVAVCVIAERRRRRRLHAEPTSAKAADAAAPTSAKAADAAAPVETVTPETVTPETVTPETVTPETVTPERKKDAVGPADVATPHTEESATRTMQKVRTDNRNVVRAWETREWNKARARIEAQSAKIKAKEDAGIKDPVKEYSKQLVAARKAGELTEQRVGQAEAEAVIGGLDKASGKRGEQREHSSTPGATPSSIAAELRRWPRPPSSSGCLGEVEAHDWPLYHDHYDWLDEMASAYTFADAGEVLRHLVFSANGETSQVKKLIFRQIRCLHCHSGTRAGHIPKKDKHLSLFDFQLVWLKAVHQQCDHPSVEKTVRVLIDYYRKVTADAPAAEAELFWRRRTDVTRGAGPSFDAYLPGVPGNYVFLRQPMKLDD